MARNRQAGQISPPIPNYKPPAKPTGERKGGSSTGCLVVLGVFLVILLCLGGAGFLIYSMVKPIDLGGIFASGTATPVSSPASTPGVTQGTLQVSVLDVGQGDSILIKGPQGSNMLIDGGEKNSGALAYLKAHGIKHIDLMVATHPDADHIGGLVDILNSLAVDEVATSGYSSTTRTYEQFLDGIIKQKAKFTEVHTGDVLTLDGVKFNVLNPDKTYHPPDPNNSSVVLRTQFGPTSFLLVGDAEKEAENRMLASGSNLQATILKVGHHGSDTSSTMPFLNAVKPQVAIYSAGYHNKYGHPTQSTLDNLTKVGAKIYGTIDSGTVTVTADSKGYTISTSK